MHTGIDSLACDKREKTFSRKDKLDNHLKTHAGRKPFTCKLCDKSFTLKTSLEEHKRTHIGEKPFSCDICNKSFTQKKQMLIHKSSHLNETFLSCDQCDKTFSKLNQLNVHKRIHNGEPIFPCDECEKIFAKSAKLRRHKLIHTGEKAYTCGRCGKSFSRTDNGKKHEFSCTSLDMFNSCVDMAGNITNDEDFEDDFILPSHFLSQELQVEEENVDENKQDDDNLNSLVDEIKENDKEIDLKKLRRKKLKIEKVQCPDCGIHVTRTNLSRHRNSGCQGSNTEYRPFPCSKCGKSFKRKEHCKRHESSCTLSPQIVPNESQNVGGNIQLEINEVTFDNDL